MGLQAEIWASRLGEGGGTLEEEEKKEEKIPHMCESIGHRPRRGRCPKREKERKQTKENGYRQSHTVDMYTNRRTDLEIERHEGWYVEVGHFFDSSYSSIVSSSLTNPFINRSITRLPPDNYQTYLFT